MGQLSKRILLATLFSFNFGIFFHFFSLSLGDISLKMHDILPMHIELIIENLQSHTEPVPIQEANSVDTENNESCTEFCTLPRRNELPNLNLEETYHML